jgi:hypothetical protein
LTGAGGGAVVLFFCENEMKLMPNKAITKNIFFICFDIKGMNIRIVVIDILDLFTENKKALQTTLKGFTKMSFTKTLLV